MPKRRPPAIPSGTRPNTREYTAAGAVVYRPADGRVLVLARPGRLTSGGDAPEVRLPKGHVEPGETIEVAAHREVAEESGFSALSFIADLGCQRVEFDWQDRHVVRHEHYLLLALTAESTKEPPEPQFERLWLTWDDALARLPYEAEREWVRRAQEALASYQTGPV